MKQNLSGWVNPFVFKEKQRANLLSTLPSRSAKDKEVAHHFIDAAQREVEVWLSMDVQLLTTAPSEQKEKLERLNKAAQDLSAALDAIPSDVGAWLRAQIYTTLYCDPYKRNHLDLGWKLNQMGNGDPCADDFLEELLAVVEESSSRAAENVAVKTGVDNKNEISLTANLARYYQTIFQKKPSASNGSNFRNFMKELGDVTGYEFGAATVKDAINMVDEVSKSFAIPAEK